MNIYSGSNINLRSNSNMNIRSGSGMEITSKRQLLLKNTDDNNRTVFEQIFGVEDYSLRGSGEDLIGHRIGDEFIEFSKRIRGIDAIQSDELTTKRQIDSKDYILSPDGQKWGISNTGETYKIT